MIRNRSLALLISVLAAVGATGGISTAVATSSHSGTQLAPPKQKIGRQCKKGIAGCSKNGRFTGNFFG